MKNNTYQNESGQVRSRGFLDLFKFTLLVLLGLTCAVIYLGIYFNTHDVPQWGVALAWAIWFISMPTAFGIVNHYRKRLDDLKKEYREDKEELRKEARDLR